MAIDFKSFFDLFTTLQILKHATWADINVVALIIWLRTTSQTNISCLSNSFWTKATTITRKLEWPFNMFNTFWLKVISKIFYCNSFKRCSQQHTILKIWIMLTLLGWLFLDTRSASKSIWIWVPFTPIKRVLELSFTISTFWIFNFRRDNKFNNVFFNFVNWLIDIF